MTDISNARYKKTALSSSQKFNLDSNMLEMLLAIDERKTLREVFREVKMDQETFKKTFFKLIEMGLIQEATAPVTLVKASVIEKMQKILIELIGPMGEIIVEDTAHAMGFKLNAIPTTAIADFIDAVSREIPSPNQSDEFKKRIIKELRS